MGKSNSLPPAAHYNPNYRKINEHLRMALRSMSEGGRAAEFWEDT
jgi:hypothetical protein